MASHFDRRVRESRVMAQHHWLRRAFGLGVVAAATYVVWRAIEANRVERDLGWEAQPFPFPPQPRAPTLDEHREHRVVAPPAPPAPRATESPWVEPVGAACPASHPIKANLRSRIFHVPGGQSYDRTAADRCYVDRGAAEADGFRAAKR
jgi:hypothetical protein